MTPAQFDSIKRYVGFDERHATALQAFYPIARPRFGPIVEDFYDAIGAHPEAMASITGGSEQVERLKKSLTTWLSEVLNGPYDEAYLAKHSRIGRVHVRIDLPQEFMFTAINRIRTQLVSLARSAADVPDDQRDSLTASLDCILDLELAIMLDTYRENFVEAIRVGERLSTLGQLSATIAHELRNPLGVIESSLFLIEKQLEKARINDATVDKHIGRISAQVESCGTTIRHMLDLARDQPLAVRMVSARELLDRVVHNAPESAGVRIEIRAADDVVFEADPTQLGIAIEKLLDNARHAVGKKGHIVVETASHGDDTWITVTDDGPGMAADVRTRAFQALFTTKESAAGLGLPVARRIAGLHGGSLEAVPTDQGACFRLSIPTRSRTSVEGGA